MIKTVRKITDFSELGAEKTTIRRKVFTVEDGVSLLHK